MPWQNRVTPFGTIEALRGRGTMLGNRGVLHNERGEIRRPWQVRRWIACVLEFRGRYRRVMEPNRYTHLFFLDEATAFAAGHRPCAECRRDDFVRFRNAWEEVHGPVRTVDEIDEVLHAARLDGKAKRTYRDDAEKLPDGTFVATGDAAWLVRGDRLYRWSDGGYREHRPRTEGTIDVLTPRPFIDVFRAGYAPKIHPSAH